ncbi:MAG: ABC transporter permease [Clostridiales bacterium]|nr:ABC transporter permease [Clostridiales bacterium]
MDILTLLRANIRRKKGTFFGIMLLMIIVSMLLITIFSLKKNVAESIDEAYIDARASDVMMNIPSERLSDELLDKVRNHPMVDHVDTCDAILIRKEILGKKEQSESWLITELNDRVTHFYNEDLTAYEDEVRPIGKGEIYVPQGVATDSGCCIDDDLILSTRSADYTLKLKGFIVEPVCGSSMVGWKTIYTSKETFQEIASDLDDDPETDLVGRVTIVYVYKKTDCELSDSAFAVQLNKDTDIQNYSYASETASQMKYYTGLFSELTCKIMLVFCAILAAVVLIIMAHNISVTIEMSYTELGVLKAQGFSQMRIRVLFAIQYILSLVIGTVIGAFLAIPLIIKFGGIFQPITGILAKNNVDVVSGGLVLLIMLLVSIVIIFLATRKVGKISPVKALTGEHSDVHFDNLLNAPISGKNLSVSLAYRQFSSRKRRYLVAILISAVLMFFMLTVNLMGSSMQSKQAMQAMGEILSEVNIGLSDRSFTEGEMKEIQEITNSTAEVQLDGFIRHEYLTLDGNSVMCEIDTNTDFMVMTSGRAPIYDNEIVITEIISDMLGIKEGDKVEVARREYKDEYIVCGIFCKINDTGKVFGMTEEGGKKLHCGGFSWYSASLVHPKDCYKVEEALKARFHDSFIMRIREDYSDADDMKSISAAVDVMKYTIYIFSVVFVLVVVSMICSKIFAQERKDLGIYKAIGFTSAKLRLMFAIRFLIIGVIGSAIGCAMSILFSEKALNKLLYSMGVTNFVSNYKVETILIPLVLLLVGFFLFAYFISRKVKKVQTRELVVE